MDTLSFWERTSFFSNIDVAVIGSGIVGLNAAIRLKEMRPALEVAVLERGVLPFGASTRNAGFACFGSLSELLDDLSTQSLEEVLALVERRWKGLQRLRQRIGDKNLQYQPLGGFEIFKTGEEGIFNNCAGKMEEFNKYLYPITGQQVYSIADDLIPQFGFQHISHVIRNEAEGQLHTGSMMKSMLALAREKGVHIFNGINIRQLEETGNSAHIITSDGWSFSAKKIIVATNGFSRRLLPELELTPARNQVLITKPIRGLPFKGSFHYDRGYFYFRNVDESNGFSRILLGGGRNLSPDSEQTDEPGNTPLIQNALTKLLEEVIIPGKKAEIDSWWSGILGIGSQKKPILKKVSPSICVSVRLGGMGVALGSLVGEEAAELIEKEL